MRPFAGRRLGISRHVALGAACLWLAGVSVVQGQDPAPGGPPASVGAARGADIEDLRDSVHRLRERIAEFGRSSVAGEESVDLAALQAMRKEAEVNLLGVTALEATLGVVPPAALASRTVPGAEEPLEFELEAARQEIAALQEQQDLSDRHFAEQQNAAEDKVRQLQVAMGVAAAEISRLKSAELARAGVAAPTSQSTAERIAEEMNVAALLQDRARLEDELALCQRTGADAEARPIEAAAEGERCAAGEEGGTEEHLALALRQIEILATALARERAARAAVAEEGGKDRSSGG